MINHLKKQKKKSAKASAPGPIYPREWRKHFEISAELVAEEMGMERESLLRMERELNRFTPDKQAQYARAIGTLPENLWRKPTSSDVPIRHGLALAAESLKSRPVTK